VTVTSTSGGTASANVPSAPQDATVTLTAVPGTGYRFARWDVISGGIALSSTTTESATFTMLWNDVVVRAVFIPTVTVINGKRLDLVSGTEIVSPSIANPGDIIHVIANYPPPVGQRFKEWIFSTPVDLHRGEIINPDIEFIMPATNVTATAMFVDLEPGEHTIIVTHIGNGIANPNVNAAVQGTMITLKAEPDAGNRFVRWEVVSGGITLSSTTTATATFVMPNENVVVRAVFERIPGTTPTSPKTGDYSNTLGWWFLLVISIMAIAGTTIYFKQRQKSDIKR